MGVDAQYFCAALMPVIDSVEQGWISRATSVVAGSKPDMGRGEGKYANVTYRLFSQPVKLAPGDATSNSYTIFLGPKRPEMLARYYADSAPGYSINDFVDYGWFDVVARGMIGLLHFFYRFVGNYGIAIIMLTVLVRGCMFPISRGQARSMANLQALRPEMDRIKEKYKGDQQKQAQAMQELYRKHKVNPLGGCLPALIQLPVFIGLYRGLAVDVELRGSPLFSENIRWCSNLAAPDMLYDWSAFMPHLVIDYLGPYLNILPLVTIVLFLLQQKMFMPAAANEQQAMQQKVMTYMMIFMGVLFYKVPSGLCLYFIASSLWGIAERKLIPPPAGEIVAAAGPEPLPSGGTREKRTPKNGRSGGRPAVKGKRSR
jgi:YidC/Oxa1 family membrane protein insertase